MEADKERRSGLPGRRSTDHTCLFHPIMEGEIETLKSESKKKVTYVMLSIVMSVLLGCLTIVTAANVYIQKQDSGKLDKMMTSMAELKDSVEDSRALMKRRMKIFEIYQEKVLKKLNIPPPEYDVFYESDDYK